MSISGRWRDLPLRRKGLVVVALPLVALLADSAALIAVTRQEQQANNEVRESIEIRATTNELLSILLDAETGVRGYLASSEPRFLEVYQAALERLAGLAEKRDRLKSADSLVDRYQRIEQLATQQVGQLVQLRGSLGVPPEELRARLSAEKATMDAVRVEIAAVQAEESKAVEDRMAESQRLSDLALLVLGAGLAFGLLGGVGAALLFTTGVVRRTAVLEDNARRLEQGFPQNPPPEGSDEVGRLGQALARAGDLLESRAEEAVTASRMKSEFLATMSHEIRTPMNGVLGMTQILLDSGLTPEQQEHAQTVYRSAEALLAVINDILDFSKIEAGRMDLESLDFDVRVSIEEVLDLLAERAHEKRLELVATIDDGVPLLSRGDPGRFRQVLLNLVGNAIKFTKEGEVVVTVSAVESSADGTVLRVDVRDTGMGVSSEAERRLFTSFTQGDASTTRTHGGTGLGLAISKQLVELMGGRIGVESVVGQGSTFWFTICLAPASTAARPSRRRLSLKGLRALVVDDNATNRTILEHSLRAWEVEATSAEGAEEALTRLRATPERFDLAILDYHMPVADGLQLASAIVEEGHLPVSRLVVLTSSGLNEDRRRARSLGVGAMLAKPVRQSALYDCLVTVLDLADETPAEENVVDEVASATPSALAPGARLLVVEDNQVNQQVARRMLETRGHVVDIAGNGAEAIEAWTATVYDAVLMDCQMPLMDGYDATRAIREAEAEAGGRRTPIIAMTAGAMVGDAEKCFAAGMDDYVTKPVQWDDLTTVLGRWTSGAPEPGSVLDESVIAALRELDEQGGGMADLVDTFVAKADRRLGDLRAAIDAGDAAAVGSICHDLRGSSGTLGAAHMAALCGECEAAVRADDLARVQHLVGELEAELRSVRGALQSAFPAKAASEPAGGGHPRDVHGP